MYWREAWDPSLGAAAPIYFDHDSTWFALGKAEAHARYLERQKLLRVQESFGKYAVYKN